jgi:hypothetical protein
VPHLPQYACLWHRPQLSAWLKLKAKTCLYKGWRVEHKICVSRAPPSAVRLLMAPPAAFGGDFPTHPACYDPFLLFFLLLPVLVDQLVRVDHERLRLYRGCRSNGRPDMDEAVVVVVPVKTAMKWKVGGPSWGRQACHERLRLHQIVIAGSTWDGSRCSHTCKGVIGGNKIQLDRLVRVRNERLGLHRSFCGDGG